MPNQKDRMPETDITKSQSAQNPNPRDLETGQKDKDWQTYADIQDKDRPMGQREPKAGEKGFVGSKSGDDTREDLRNRDR